MAGAGPAPREVSSPMRIITCNVNGIRSAARKGFFPWLSRQRADVVCLQETKAQEWQLEDDRVFRPRAFHRVMVDAEKKGYSGVAIYSRREPDAVITSLAEASGGDAGWDEFDREGRYVEARFDNLSVVSIYLPSGSSGDVRQAAKYRFLDRFLPHLEGLLRDGRRSGREYVLCGDFNIAHKKIDLRNWRSNQKNSGFLPEERAWMDALIHERGFVDAFREIEPGEDQYTWWSNRGQAWDRNVGWRLDYQILTPSLSGSVRKARIYKDKRFSDHAPLIMDYDW
jgi:exodeoxyribonuclease-3